MALDPQLKLEQGSSPKDDDPPNDDDPPKEEEEAGALVKEPLLNELPPPFPFTIVCRLEPNELLKLLLLLLLPLDPERIR